MSETRFLKTRTDRQCPICKEFELNEMGYCDNCRKESAARFNKME